MNYLDEARAEAAATLIATINDVVAHGGTPSQMALAKSTVNAIARFAHEHAIATRDTNPGMDIPDPRPLSPAPTPATSPAAPLPPPKPPGPEP